MKISIVKKAITSFFASLFVLITSSCIPLVGKVHLSFKYMSISYSSGMIDFTFVEDDDYPDLISTYEVDKHHVISEEDLSNIDLLTSSIPHNEGGYYTKSAYYSDAIIHRPAIN